MRATVSALTLGLAATVGCGLIRPYDSVDSDAALDRGLEKESEGEPDANKEFFGENASVAKDSGVAPDGGVTYGSGGFSQACLRVPNLPVAKGIHVISVYTPAKVDVPDLTGNGKGTITVNVAAGPDPVTLYLNSHIPVAWRIVPAVGATIARIVASSSVPTETTVSGTMAPVVKQTSDESGGAAYGWEPQYNADGDQTYSESIRRIRAREGNIETSFQGEYAASSFAIPYAVAPTSHYESSKTCLNQCAIPAASFTWRSPEPFEATVSGATATAKGSWSIVEGTHGASCGKHYFELNFAGVGGGADMNVLIRGSALDPRLGESRSPNDSFLRSVTATTLGVALDLDALTATYQTKTGALEGAKVTTTVNVWTYGEVVPVVLLRQGSVRFVGRPPFQLTPPVGYGADL